MYYFISEDRGLQWITFPTSRSSRVGADMFDDHTPKPADICPYENVRHISLEKVQLYVLKIIYQMADRFKQ